MRIAAGILVGVLLLAGVAGVATHAYHLGIAQGAAAASQGPPPAAGMPAPYYYAPYFYHGPFGFVGFLFPIAFLFLALAVIGRLFARRGGRWARGCGGNPTGVPPMFEEWHRRSHEAMGKPQTS